MAKKAYWNYRTGDMGAYIQCSHCGRKVSTKEFMIADKDWFECPDCKAEMNLARLDYDTIAQEALNER